MGLLIDKEESLLSSWRKYEFTVLIRGLYANVKDFTLLLVSSSAFLLLFIIYEYFDIFVLLLLKLLLLLTGIIL